MSGNWDKSSDWFTIFSRTVMHSRMDARVSSLLSIFVSMLMGLTFFSSGAIPGTPYLIPIPGIPGTPYLIPIFLGFGPGLPGFSLRPSVFSNCSIKKILPRGLPSDQDMQHNNHLKKSLLMSVALLGNMVRHARDDNSFCFYHGWNIQTNYH